MLRLYDTRTFVTTTMLCFVCVAAAYGETNWPRFRGPDGTGQSSEKGLPVEWDEGSIAWKTELPGAGHSSPVIWGGRIFLTTALEGGRQRAVVCVDRSTGKILWQQSVETGDPESLHKMNSLATASCATDGEQVIAFYGRGGIHAYDLVGKKQWSVNLGKFEGPWGVAASPVIVGDLVVQNCDADQDAYLIGLNKTTGKEVWRTDRINIRGWSTPVLIEAGKRQELVLNGHHGVRGYDPKTGEELWFCKSFNGRGTPSPAVGHGLVFMVNGLKGDLYAVRPGGTGDVTKSHMAWHAPRSGGRDLPSPILVGKYLFVVSMGGVGTCYDATTGKTLWTERLGGKFSASPIAANGLVYTQNEAGETLVIRPGETLDLVARNTVGSTDKEIFRASLAPSDGRLYLRSDRVLYCIGKRIAAGR